MTHHLPWEDTRARVYGYKAIGAVLRMSKSAVHRYSDPERYLFPLPMYHCPAGWFSYEDELKYWFARWKMIRGTERAMERRSEGTARTLTRATRRRRGEKPVANR